MIGLIMLLLLLMGGCMGYTFIPNVPDAAMPPPVAPPVSVIASNGVAVLLSIQDTDFSDQQLEETFAGLERRLNISDYAGGAVSTFGATCLEIQIYDEEADTSAIAALIAPGLVELVDFSGISREIAQGFEGQLINTTAMSHENALHHPDTGQPFETVITGAQMDNTSAHFSELTGSWYVEFTLTPDGAEILGPFTGDHIGELLAIVYEGQVMSVPVIQAPLDTGGIIEMNFTQEEAEALAIQLNSGALPLSLEIIALDILSAGSPFVNQDFAIDTCG